MLKYQDEANLGSFRIAPFLRQFFISKQSTVQLNFQIEPARPESKWTRFQSLFLSELIQKTLYTSLIFVVKKVNKIRSRQSIDKPE